VSASDASFDVDTNRVIVFSRDGNIQELEFGSKSAVAGTICDLIAEQVKNNVT